MRLQFKRTVKRTVVRCFEMLIFSLFMVLLVYSTMSEHFFSFSHCSLQWQWQWMSENCFFFAKKKWQRKNEKTKSVHHSKGYLTRKKERKERKKNERNERAIKIVHRIHENGDHRFLFPVTPDTKIRNISHENWEQWIIWHLVIRSNGTNTTTQCEQYTLWLDILCILTFSFSSPSCCFFISISALRCYVTFRVEFFFLVLVLSSFLGYWIRSTFISIQLNVSCIYNTNELAR